MTIKHLHELDEMQALRFRKDERISELEGLLTKTRQALKPLKKGYRGYVTEYQELDAEIRKALEGVDLPLGEER